MVDVKAAILSVSITVLLSGTFACIAKAEDSPQEFFAKTDEEPETYFDALIVSGFDADLPSKLFGEAFPHASMAFQYKGANCGIGINVFAGDESDPKAPNGAALIIDMSHTDAALTRITPFLSNDEMYKKLIGGEQILPKEPYQFLYVEIGFKQGYPRPQYFVKYPKTDWVTCLTPTKSGPNCSSTGEVRPPVSLGNISHLPFNSFIVFASKQGEIEAKLKALYQKCPS